MTCSHKEPKSWICNQSSIQQHQRKSHLKCCLIDRPIVVQMFTTKIFDFLTEWTPKVHTESSLVYFRYPIKKIFTSTKAKTSCKCARIVGTQSVGDFSVKLAQFQPDRRGNPLKTSTVIQCYLTKC